MHFLGGYWLGIAFFYVFPQKETSARLIFSTLFFVLGIGLGWEVYEALVNNIITQNPFNFLDSISDICFDLSGGLCAILYIWKKMQKKQ